MTESFERRISKNQDLSFHVFDKTIQSQGITMSDALLKDLELINEDNSFTNLALLLSNQCPYEIYGTFFQGNDVDILRDRCEFSGSLLKQYDEAFRYINFHNRIKATFIKKITNHMLILKKYLSL